MYLLPSAYLNSLKTRICLLLFDESEVLRALGGLDLGDVAAGGEVADVEAVAWGMGIGGGGEDDGFGVVVHLSAGHVVEGDGLNLVGRAVEVHVGAGGVGVDEQGGGLMVGDAGLAYGEGLSHWGGCLVVVVARAGGEDGAGAVGEEVECGAVDAGYGGVGAGVGHGEAAGGGGGEGDGAVGEGEVEILLPDDGLFFAVVGHCEGIVVIEGDDGHAVLRAVVEMKVAEVLWRSDDPAQTKVASVVNGGPIEVPCMVSRDSHRFHQRAISCPMLDKIAN